MSETEAVQAMQQLPAEVALMRIENETIQSMALAHPRNYKTILASIVEQVELFPAFAEKAIYSRPVGKDDSGRQVFATGLSVRAAEAIAEAYGYCRVRCSTTMQTPDLASVDAVFVDYQRGRIWQQNILVSRFQKRRDGTVYALSAERFELLQKAKSSIAIREVILRSVPPGLRAALEEKVRAAVRLDGDRILKIIDAFKARGVDKVMLQAYLGKPPVDWTNADRLHLLETMNAIEEGEATVASVFSVQADEDGPSEEPKKKDVASRVKEKLKATEPAAENGAPPTKEEMDAADAAEARKADEEQRLLEEAEKKRLAARRQVRRGLL